MRNKRLPFATCLLGFAIFAIAPPAQATLIVSYKITVGAPAGGVAELAGYLNDVQPLTRSTLGSTFAGPDLAATSVTAAGNVYMQPGVTSYLQLEGNSIGPVWDKNQAPYLAATFTAPPGYVFSETGHQYLSTKNTAAWGASSIKWGDVGFPADATKYTVTTPTPPLTGYPKDPAVAPQALWANSTGFPPSPVSTLYLDTWATLAPGVWTVFGTPVPSISQPQGLSAHIVRVQNDLKSFTDAENALSLRPNQVNHDVSEVRSIYHADLGSAGHYVLPVGYLPGDAHSASASPEDYAARVAGYIYAPSNDYIQTFAVSGDSEFYFKIGSTEFLREGGVPTPPFVAAARFPTAGYWPIELVWRNRDGGAGLEISSRAGWWNAADWNTTDFKILGTDPSYPVYQRPAAVPSPSELGANSVGNPLYVGTIPPVTDGFRVQQAYPASHGGANPTDVQNAIGFFANYANRNAGITATRTRMDMQDTTPGEQSPGNFGATAPIPLDDYNTSYVLQPGVANDNYVTRINGLFYVPSPGVQAFTVGTDEGYYLRIGNQVLGRTVGGRTMPSGTANYVYGYFPQAGLYPFEFYQFEGTGASGLEIGHGGSTGLLLGNHNPNGTGFTIDFDGVAYTVDPVAYLHAVGMDVLADAWGNVPALGMNVPPEHWQLWEYTANWQLLAEGTGMLIDQAIQSFAAGSFHHLRFNSDIAGLGAEFVGDFTFGEGVIPEPGSMALLVGGLLALGRRRRRLSGPPS